MIKSSIKNILKNIISVKLTFEIPRKSQHLENFVSEKLTNDKTKNEKADKNQYQVKREYENVLVARKKPGKQGN